MCILKHVKDGHLRLCICEIRVTSNCTSLTYGIPSFKEFTQTHGPLFIISRLPVAGQVKGPLRRRGIELPILDSQEHAGSGHCREPLPG